MHDRAIFRPVDDSVVFTFRDEVVPLRRARGFAPQPLHVAGFAPGEPLHAVRARRILATGGELKSTVCLLAHGQAVLSEHLGDLSGAANYRHFVDAIARLEQLCGVTPEIVAVDLHPQYLATQYGQQRGLPVIAVQHHHAHIASVMAEWGVVEPVIGIACDGTGYGTDGASWGGEVLLCERGTFERLGHLTYFPLVGGDAAALETWRPAAALLHAAGVENWAATIAAAPFDHLPDEAHLRLFDRQRTRGINAPPTSSLGRIFDAVAFLLGLCAHNRHEAEAALALEAAAAATFAHCASVPPLPYAIQAPGAGPTDRPTATPWQLDLLPAIRELAAAPARGTAAPVLAARFHETVARLFTDAAIRSARLRGVRSAALSGGCFANRILLQRMVTLLEDAGLRVLYHRRVPSGDGGLALGQAWLAAWECIGEQR